MDGLATRIQVLEELQEECRTLITAQRNEYLTSLNELRHELQELKEEKISKAVSMPEVRTSQRTTELSNAQDTAGQGEALGVKPSFRLQTKDFETHNGVASYYFTPSMWDAAFLVFFKEVGWVDKSILIVGLLCNHALQTLMLAVVFCDMLDNPFEDDTVLEMLNWRVAVGHSDALFDQRHGHSLLGRLCNNSLWSFEQSEYREMHDYLYKPIPGYLLSLLAVVLWILTTISEYRRTVEQGLAICTLPASRGNQPCMVASGGVIRIVGIRQHTRALAMFVLTIPRMLVVSLISVVGCQYLAQTPSLHDIVLNAVALAFVLDVDEELFSVFCTQRIRSLVDALEPLPCGHRPDTVFRTIQKKDVIRYVLVVGLVLFAYFQYLAPFAANVEGAAAALCGGDYNFSYKGGSPGNRTVVLYDAADHEPSCPRIKMDQYLSTYYGDYNASLPDIDVPDVVDITAIRNRIVMNYAFSQSCGPGEILMPVLLEDRDKPRVCKATPHSLTEVLPVDVRPGSVPPPERCEQFQPELRGDACDSTPARTEACLWTWGSYRCEQDPPGEFRRTACSNQLTPTPDEVRQACKTWRWFNQNNPYYHCRAVEACQSYPDLDCFAFVGKIVMDWKDEETPPLTLAEASANGILVNNVLPGVRLGLSYVSGVPRDRVVMSEDWQVGLAPGGRQTGVERLTVEFILRRCPVSFWAGKFMRGNPGRALADWVVSTTNKVFSNILNRTIRRMAIENVTFDTTTAILDKHPPPVKDWPWYISEL